MEAKILDLVKKSLDKAMAENLSGYNSPLNDLVKKVISENSQDLYNIMNGEVIALIKEEGFKKAFREAIHGKLAKVLVGRLSGELEKRVNELKQNPQTRAKITLAINEIIEEL